MAKFIESIKKGFGRGKQLKASLDSLAEKYKGEVKIPKFLGLQTYRFLRIRVPNGEANLRVTPGGDKTPPVTQIEIKHDISTKIKFSIFTENIFTRIAAKLGMQDIKIDNSEFDKKFMLKSNDIYFLKEFMDKEVQQCVIDINELIGGYRSQRGLSISLKKNKLIIKKTAYITEEDKLDIFINRCLKVYGKLILKLK